MAVPKKANGGYLNLAQREELVEPGSPSKLLPVCPPAPQKKQGLKRACDEADNEVGEELLSPYKPPKQIPQAPLIKRHLSFVENYEEDPDEWMEDSFIPEIRPNSWAPYHVKHKSRRNYHH